MVSGVAMARYILILGIDATHNQVYDKSRKAGCACRLVCLGGTHSRLFVCLARLAIDTFDGIMTEGVRIGERDIAANGK